MLMMRPATVEDQAPIENMIRSRGRWMREQGVPGGGGWAANAAALAAQAADPAFPVWVLTDDDSGTETVVGCTSLFEESPPWFWTEAERVEPAIFLASTVTDPAHTGRRLGCQIVWWALDHAARTGRTWVRRHATEPGLVRYYTQVQGWEVVRTLDKNGFTVTGMTRRAQRQPDLACANH